MLHFGWYSCRKIETKLKTTPLHFFLLILYLLLILIIFIKCIIFIKVYIWHTSTIKNFLDVDFIKSVFETNVKRSMLYISTKKVSRKWKTVWMFVIKSGIKMNGTPAYLSFFEISDSAQRHLHPNKSSNSKREVSKQDNFRGPIPCFGLKISSKSLFIH